MTAPPGRYIIVNADDFGQTEGINRGIITAHEEGIVTSASLMVRWPAAQSAAHYARQHPQLGVGLHIDLGEWKFCDGEWLRVYDVVDSDDPKTVGDEVERQVATFRSLLGTNPTHLDSHQHVHRDEPARTIVNDLAREFGIPVRHFDRRVTYCGDFYGQDEKGEPFHEGISVDNLMKILSNLPEGTTELACHPGFVGPDSLDTQYGAEREMEIKALSDPRVRESIERENVVCLSFKDIR